LNCWRNSAVFFVKNLILSIHCTKYVISTKEKSPQVTPQREPNLCRASCGDFSFVEMTKNANKSKFLKKIKSKKSVQIPRFRFSESVSSACHFSALIFNIFPELIFGSKIGYNKITYFINPKTTNQNA